ncbi:hypothetical protein G1C96_0140 [Bifidobacterium sp. DSM 109958]|uniref:Uncharacterized protein n=1 Tax=Bifidobacterium moraviense TaxID=2675323 RepID=A0A7Y0F041_9BIFI|nr:hypothetical protein [Bifidobacterium sp. DSM 109958]NMM99563.1 hypothetical protein [Bifidobacterium sp. DSM 109958]
MRIIERRCRGKRADRSLNEDGLLVTDGFAVVADGVTSKSERRPWRPSGGVVAKDLLLSTIERLPPDSTMRDVQRAVDARFRAEYEAHALGADFFAREPVERLQVNAVVLSAAHREAWLFGDCQIMVNGVRTPTEKRVDELLGRLRSFAAHALMLQCDGNAVREDAAREMIMPFLRLQSRFANRRGEYGYFVFDGFTDPTYPIRTVPVSPGDEVVLASDGYPLLRPTLAESERELERLRREDPMLIDEYRTTKGFEPGLDSFDDRTYLRLVV